MQTVLMSRVSGNNSIIQKYCYFSESLKLIFLKRRNLHKKQRFETRIQYWTSALKKNTVVSRQRTLERNEIHQNLKMNHFWLILLLPGTPYRRGGGNVASREPKWTKFEEPSRTFELVFLRTNLAIGNQLGYKRQINNIQNPYLQLVEMNHECTHTEFWNRKVAMIKHFFKYQ